MRIYKIPLALKKIFDKKMILVGTREQRMFILGQMQKLTNDKLGVRRSTGEVIIMDRGTKNINRCLKTGTSLISSMVNNKYTATVRITKNESCANDRYRLDAINGKGTDTQIEFNENENARVLTKNRKNGKISKEIIPSHIVLGHELIHGLRSMSGTATYNDNLSLYNFMNMDGKIDSDIKKTEELETVGILYDERNKNYTENKLREEQNLNIRIKY